MKRFLYCLFSVFLLLLVSCWNEPEPEPETGQNYLIAYSHVDRIHLYDFLQETSTIIGGQNGSTVSDELFDVSENGDWVVFRRDSTTSASVLMFYDILKDSLAMLNDSITGITEICIVPSGNHIIFTANNNDQKDIFIMNKDGSNCRILEENESFESFIKCPGNGSYLYYLTIRNYQRDVYRLPVTGGNSEKLTNSDNSIQYFWVNADSNAVYYWGYYNSYSQKDIFKKNVLTGTCTQISDDFSAGPSVKLSPDGKYLSYISNELEGWIVHLMDSKWNEVAQYEGDRSYFFPDSKYLICSTAGGSYCHDIENGTSVFKDLSLPDYLYVNIVKKDQ